MRTAFVVILTGILLQAGGVWSREHWDVVGIEALVVAGHPDRAYSACRALSSRPLWFLDRADVSHRCDAAARTALTAALAAERFEPAAEYCAELLAPPDTGYEAEARPTCGDLGRQHARYIERLIGKGEEDVALAEVTTAAHLYPEAPEVLADLRRLRADAQAGRFDRLVAMGDVPGAIDVVADLEPEVSAAVMRRVEARLDEAWTLSATAHVGGHNFPAVLESYARLRERLRRPELRYRLALAYRRSLQELFHLPAAEDVRDVLDEVAPPPVDVAGQAVALKQATLTFQNRTDRKMWVVLRGEEQDYWLGAIPPFASRMQQMRLGRYAQVVHAGRGIHPYVGVIQVPEIDATQAFSIGRDGAVQDSGQRRAAE